jgi:predicted phage tail protein
MAKRPANRPDSRPKLTETDSTGFGPVPSGRGMGKKPKQPKTEEQKVFTESELSILGVLCEGPIEGIIGGDKGVRIDGTPLQNPDNSYNFNNVRTDYRRGDWSQARMPGFGDEVVNQRTVGTTVKANLPPPVKQINNRDVDTIAVSLSFTMQRFPKKGGVAGSTIEFEIWIKEGNLGFTRRKKAKVSGRIASPVVYDFRFEVLPGKTDYAVKVVRLTPESTNPDELQQTLEWVSLAEIVTVKMTYPNSAIYGVGVDAKQFGNIPEFSFDCGGWLLDIPVGHDVDPVNRRTVRRAYYEQNNITWDGQFWRATIASSDPAWQLYNLLSNPVAGMGRYVTRDRLDKWSFYALSQWCSELISDGKGGLEPRFSCNVLLGDKEDAWRTLDALRSVFRGFLYYLNGTVYAAFDSPKVPVMQFTRADVIDGIFNYVRPPLSGRYSVAIVTWIDANDNYQQAIEQVFNDDLIDEMGYRPLELSAFGCTSQGQANRAGRMALHYPETVSFTARDYAHMARPGDVISIFDSRRLGLENGGLVVDYSTPAQDEAIVKLDRPVVLKPGLSYQLSVTLPSGFMEQVQVNTPPGSRLELTIDAPSQPLLSGCNWVLISAELRPTSWTVVNVTSRNDSNYTTHEIFAIEHDPTLWATVENGLFIEPREPQRRPPEIVPVPRNVVVSGGFVQNDLASIDGSLAGAVAAPSLYVSWAPPINSDGTSDAYVSGYVIELQRGDEDWGEGQSTNGTSVQFDGLQPNVSYAARVATVYITGAASTWVESPPVALSRNLVLQLNQPTSAISVPILL